MSPFSSYPSEIHFSSFPSSFQSGKSKRVALLLLAARYDDEEEKRISQRKVQKVLWNVTEALGTKLSSNRKDGSYNKQNARNSFLNAVKSRDYLTITAENTDSFELPSVPLVIMDQNLQEISKALLNSRPDLPNEYFNLPSSKSRKYSQQDENMMIQHLEERLNVMKQQHQQQQHNNSKMDKDSSFQAVFENESGFFNQSEAFRMYLAPKNFSEDPKTIIHKAVTSRRGEDYRRRQKEALDKIQQAMIEVENTSISQSSVSTHLSSYETCSCCGCRLTNEEITQAKQEKSICRGCFVEQKEFKNGSPYLIGRVADTANIWKNTSPKIVTNYDNSLHVKPKQFISSNLHQQPSFISSSAYTSSSSYTTRPPSITSTSSSSFKTNAQSESIKTTIPVVTNRKVQDSQQLSTIDRSSYISPSIVEKLKILQDELEIYKKRAENAENELVILRNIIVELETKLQNRDENNDNHNRLKDLDEDQSSLEEVVDPNGDEYWVSMEDPDTGEIFRWNKYTGEMDW